MDRIDRFRIFVRVVESASFTRTAASLNMPRSSVSAAIQALERQLGVRLLARTTRRVAPTREGEAFYARCCQLLADIESAETLFQRGKTALSGTLRVNLPSRVGRLVVAPALPAFLDRYPGINVELGSTDRMINLVEEGVDCTVRVGPLPDSGLIARPIGSLSLINVASPDYLRRYGTPRQPGDLARHVMVRYVSPTTDRAEDWEWQENGSTHTQTLPSRVTANSADMYIACCLAGMGLIQIPAYDVAQPMRWHQLVEVLASYRAKPLPMTLLYPSRQYQSRRFNVFADWLLALLQRVCCV